MLHTPGQWTCMSAVWIQLSNISEFGKYLSIRVRPTLSFSWILFIFRKQSGTSCTKLVKQYEYTNIKGEGIPNRRFESIAFAHLKNMKNKKKRCKYSWIYEQLELFDGWMKIVWDLFFFFEDDNSSVLCVFCRNLGRVVELGKHIAEIIFHKKLQCSMLMFVLCRTRRKQSL